MRIKVSELSDRHKLIIKTGLLGYRYIMDHRGEIDDDFESVYYDYYLDARWSVLSLNGKNDGRNRANRKAYFDCLREQLYRTVAETHESATIVDEKSFDVLKSIMHKVAFQYPDRVKKTEHYEFSICSKLLHTINPKYPIYDSKVRYYLSSLPEKEGVGFHWNTPKSGAARGTTEIEIIKHDWTELCKWYTRFLGSNVGKQWIAKFNEYFPEYENPEIVSDVKKIDFIIFAAGDDYAAK